MPANPAANHRDFGPDLIRAAAVTMVLMAHSFPGGTVFPLLGIIRGFWGFLGVELFFVLSGYLIGGILLNNLHEGKLNSFGGVVTFWKRRWFRTLPNYYLFLGLFLLQIYCSPQIAPRLPFDQWHLPEGWARYLWFGQATFTPQSGFYQVVWSLAIEEWFYLLFPLALLLLVKQTGDARRAIVATMAIFLVIPPIIRMLLSAHFDFTIIRELTFPRLDAITYGVALAYLKLHHTAVWNFMGRFWPVGAVVAAGMCVDNCCRCTIPSGPLSFNSTFSLGFYFCFVSISLALIFPKLTGLSAPASWWALAIRKMSLWSYSIYLSHVLVLGVIETIFPHVGVQLRPGGFSLVLRDVLTWITTIPFSAMVYRFYEKPLMDLRDRPLNSFFRRSALVRTGTA